LSLARPFIASVAVCGFAIGAAWARDPPLLSLTLEHFRDTATLKDEPQDPKVTISTKNGYVEHSGPMRMVWHDEFLTAVIDKATGQKSFQVQDEITYSGGWRFYESANYPTANGALSAPAIQISKDAANCAVGDCTYTEHVAFSVGEDLLRQLAAAHVPAKPIVWSYKVVARSGPAYTGGISDAEIAGLLAKVDEYTGAAAPAGASTPGASTPGASTPGASSRRPGASAAHASSRLDLGIGGMPVAATADQPTRAGILIIAVNRGSVAQKSGIIVGDIVYEFDGHPIKALQQLYAALAACDPNSAIPIKLFRGTEPMTVTARF
jgi:PDZ domain